MRERGAVREVMRREYVGVTESDPVRGAAELMSDDSVESAIVLRGNEPVGIVTAPDIVALVASDEDVDETDVGEIMREPVISIRADRAIQMATETMADRAVRELVVLEDDDSVAGVVSEHDLIRANVVFQELGGPDQPAEATVDVGGQVSEPSEETESADPYTQGVCEVCGTLTADLSNVNGQLVCTDCHSV